jgi:hypothetical protein
LEAFSVCHKKKKMAPPVDEVLMPAIMDAAAAAPAAATEDEDKENRTKSQGPSDGKQVTYHCTE